MIFPKWQIPKALSRAMIERVLDFVETALDKFGKTGSAHGIFTKFFEVFLKFFFGLAEQCHFSHKSALSDPLCLLKRLLSLTERLLHLDPELTRYETRRQVLTIKG
ncbi:MAG: hypothetical protein A2X94_16360 [Bdellovibrionales bacterium GWB1_55_8]|nr:MAG: hypothetical protein A2X94_16360 [Bdellovibrionales bacterium GWB1_55_8]